MAARRVKPTVRSLRKELKNLQAALETSRQLRESDSTHFYAKEKVLKDQLAANEDRLLPQKQMVLKELAYLTNATARAVRTTMWSMAPAERRGGFGR